MSNLGQLCAAAKLREADVQRVPEQAGEARVMQAAQARREYLRLEIAALMPQGNPEGALELAHQKNKAAHSPGGIRTRDLVAENHVS